MSDRKVIRVSEETEAAIRAYGESKGVQIGEAADLLIGTATARLNALKRYSANKQPQAPGKPRAKKAAAKAKSKGAKKTAAKRVRVEKKPKASAALNGAAEHHAEA